MNSISVSVNDFSGFPPQADSSNINLAAACVTGRRKNRGLSVGLKMMIGVGLFSNLCMGVLLYVNFTTFSQIASKTNSLLEVNSSMNEQLRFGIFDLQKKYLEIPKFLETDATQEILDWIATSFFPEKVETLKGPDQYRGLYNRIQRRDLAGGKFLIGGTEDLVTVSKGLMDNDGVFSDAVVRIHITSKAPEQDLEKIKSHVNEAEIKANNRDALKEKVVALKTLLADEAIAAETARNEILYKMEDLQKQKTELISYRREKRNTIAAMAVLAIVINLFMLHFMAYYMVENPLKQLIRAIEKINRGETVRIPFQKKRDQIGILAGALENFQAALTNLQKEGERKKIERSLIQDLVQRVTRLIDGLQKKATAMKDTAEALSRLASDAENQTQEATLSASRTVEQTDMVSGSTRQLESAAADINVQVSKQTGLISDINRVTTASSEDILELTRASEQISEIVHIVKNLAGESKLLALNARIEAARSGAAGKGFAVVAEEVRSLSLQTEAANGDIAEKIESIQKVSRTIVENTRRIETRVEKLMETSGHILAAVEEQALVTGGIAQNSFATNRDIKDVSERIFRVTGAARSTNQFAKTVESCSEEIAAELALLLTETEEKLSLIGLEK